MAKHVATAVGCDGSNSAGALLKTTQQRAMRAWVVWLNTRRKIRTEISRLRDAAECAVRRDYWKLWHQFSLCCVVRLRLERQRERRILFGCWRCWWRALIHKKRLQLMVRVTSLYTPHSWMREVEAQQAAAYNVENVPFLLSLHPRSAVRGRAGDCHGFEVLALRSYFIRWLGETMCRRGRRLMRYDAARESIKKRAEMSTRAGRYHTWLLYVATRVYGRRVALKTCQRYFRKWSLFLRMEKLCRKHRAGARRRLKLSLMQIWRERTACRLRVERLMCLADEFFETNSQRRRRLACFDRWKDRLRLREEYQALEAEVNERRAELLRDVTVDRILRGVLLHFYVPSAEAAVVPVAEQRNQLQGAHAQYLGCSKHPQAPESSAVQQGGTDPEPADDEASSSHGTVVALHRRLTNRCPAIPLHSRTVTHTVTQRQRGSCERGFAPGADPPSVRSNSPAAAPSQLMAQPTPCTAALSTPPPSDVSNASFCASSRLNVSEGRKLVEEYRLMLSTAPSEREEIRVIRAKLRLFKLQRQHSGGSLSAEDELSERAQVLRLMALQQRGLDRKALRARVEQLSKHLEAVVNPLSSAHSVTSGF
uniref:Uncharacterized protein TCIL3000_8_8040 n=1 Tax=Trypanosoma congolense (strain IL3000) TaxID=1068625 RepID=G0UT61_TRYCI|nr:unnamed protein product [Trypanosoma congolense IL3000]